MDHTLFRLISTLSTANLEICLTERNEIKEKLDPSARLVKLNQEYYFVNLYLLLWWTGGDRVGDK